MATIKIDNNEYELDALSEDARGQINSLQYVDAELERLKAQMAVLQTARMAYANALKGMLPNFQGDTIQFN